MTAPFAWIRPEPHGIHVVPADCWIDPSRPVENALVTHGHADHARGGHGRTVATPETLAIMELRYQTRDGAMPVSYGETIRLPGEVDVTYLPAGHVLGRCGHAPQLEQPTAFRELLATFLGGG